MFTAVELWAMIDDRFLGRLRYLNIAHTTEWGRENEGAEVGALEMLLQEVDRDNWKERRWHYADLPPMGEAMTYEGFLETRMGQKMRPRLRILRNR
jgi:hypothetical protein